MKLTIGWWKARDGSKWYVNWVGENRAVGHSESGIAGMWDTHDGESISNSGIIQDLVESWTEQKLRQWKPEEVPLGGWIRNKGGGKRCMITEDATNYIRRLWLKDYEHSLDNGKTWLPCGVME